MITDQLTAESTVRASGQQKTKMATVWQQQVFALDAKYNAYRATSQPNFRNQYIRRRNQLLREFTRKEDSAVRRQYVKLRTQLLQQRYGSTYSDQTSLRSQSLSIRSSSRVSESQDSTLPSLYDEPKQSGHYYGSKSSAYGTVVPTKQAEASRAIVGGNTIAENYAFVGVHYIFDQHKSAVTMVKFANNDRSRLCCSSTDGTLSICNVTSSPPSVEAVLHGHMGQVTGCDWSISNDLIVSSSADATIRLWEVSSPPRCLRSVPDPGHAKVLCCAFLPANSNMVIAGNARGILQVLNISTGIYPRNGGCKMGGKVLSIACESAGRIVWAGNDKGDIASFLFDAASGRLKKCKTFNIAENCAITCLSWRAWMNREARDPTLLVNCATNAVCIFRVDQNSCLQLRRKYAVRHKVHLVQSTFCPIMSFRQGACIVTGSEDCCVYFLDIERESSKCVNKLQGHACPVLSVAFNYDESLLASSDIQGLVIIWKRDQQLIPPTNTT